MNTSKPAPRGEAPFVPGVYECGDCKDIIWSRYRGHFCSCKCNASFVDDTGRYSRFGGACQQYKGPITLDMLRASDRAIHTIKKILDIKK